VEAYSRPGPEADVTPVPFRNQQFPKRNRPSKFFASQPSKTPAKHTVNTHEFQFSL
jgi:hypothetical protein